MSEPNLLAQAGAQAQKADHSLWHRAPGWRNLTVAASVLTLVAVAIPVLLPQPVDIGLSSRTPPSHVVSGPIADAAGASNMLADQPAHQPVAPVGHDAVASPLDTASLPARSGPAPGLGGPPQNTASPSALAPAPIPDQPAGTIVASPGVLVKVNRHNRYHQGQDWPISITVISPPAHGTLSIQDGTAPITYQDGVTRMSAMKQVFYKSEPGYTGIDKFTYKRVSGDPADPLNTNTYTMTVYVK